MKDYINYISLGYFCEVADDLGKLGLRNQSSPFDWGISCFPNVIEAIDKRFEGFMIYSNLSQNIHNRSDYRDDHYNFYFFHDFNKFEALSKQYDFVKQKYDRRIKRFLESITSPTLFVRYISSKKTNESNKSTELDWIERNYDYILCVLKKYNKDNDIVFIGDETIHSDVIKVYTVHKDKNDRVSRSPIINNKELYPILSSIDFPNKKSNMERYDKILKKRHFFLNRLKKKIVKMAKAIFIKEYHHDKVYDIIEQ